MTAEYLSVRSSSLLLDGIAEGTIREAVTRGELSASRFGRSLRIAREDLLSWAKSKAAK